MNRQRDDHPLPPGLKPPANAPEAPPMLCSRCEVGHLHRQAIRTAFWRGESLVVIRNIPALVCPTCGEEYLDDRTALGLDRMRGNGFSGAADRMIVPVLDYLPPTEGAP